MDRQRKWTLDVSTIGKGRKMGEQINLVNELTKTEPDYKLSGRVNSIISYINIKNELLIVGQADNNYIYWASKAESADRKGNEQLFNMLAGGVFEMVSSMDRILEILGIPHSELNGFYKKSFDRSDENEPERVWNISDGGFYRRCDAEGHGRLFAYEMGGMLKDLQEQSRVREADGAYLKVLENNLKRLKKAEKDVYGYEKEYRLIQLLEKEKYLLLSKDERVRTVYFQIKEKIHSMYCTYMSAVK